MSKEHPDVPQKIFSHPVRVDEIPEQGIDVSLSADAPTREALAKADRLVGIAALDADFHVARQGLSQFNVTGTVQAKITQICVLTLEPFDSDVVEEVDVDFAEPSEAERAAAEADALSGTAHPADRDPPDPIEDGAIDLGALAAEFLALGLDPYPRKPGAEFAAVADPHDVAERPFDVLKKLTGQS
ncbi:metal-binding protein [Methylovirgula ligni]|uniref:Uncharacterized protein DUF177 involved in 23S rRNA accumulation n=1 Tax=Methylovirgula ligni TaxID=569860 RepID=A0A3D9YUF3_9HYPH|nr:DUF177 domain-containing protein [Methylovirgula ligni]QAY96085.1 metal-binding protein [Methylovirgula ligni]REF86237.1 uncharacterized protein DUF177 involved in 23S rRNA accumulation [Methylovirgula ligni]